MNMFLMFALIFVASVSDVFTVPSVIVLSFESFQMNYINKLSTPYLYNLLNEAARPRYMTSVFPTKSVVTHVSLSTGVYPEIHGVYGNRVFDTEDLKFRTTDDQVQNEPIMPIWIENQKTGKGRNTGIMMWPGSELTFGFDDSYKPTYFQKYDKNIGWSDRVNEIVKWMTMPTNRANLVMAYFEYTKCHDKTKQKEHLSTHIFKVDYIISRVFNELNKIKRTIRGDVDVIIISGNGTQKIEYDCVMKIEDYISPIIYPENVVKVIVSGPIVYIKPNQELYSQIFSELIIHKNNELSYTVHTKDTFHDYQKMNTTHLSNIIVLVAKNGYTFYQKSELEQIVADVGENNFVTEENGYDIFGNNMEAVFLGVGPSFKKNITTVSPFSIIDVYPLLKKLLNLPDPASSSQKNVSLHNIVKQMLSEYISLNRLQLTYKTIP